MIVTVSVMCNGHCRCHGWKRRASARWRQAGDRGEAGRRILADEPLTAQEDDSAAVAKAAFIDEDVVIRVRVVARAVVECLEGSQS